MPVTPQFSLSQDETFVYVRLRVPYVRVSDLEYTIEGCAVSVYVKPYLLKLSLPGEVEDDERTKAEYDPVQDNGTVTMHLPKREKGQHFQDLDLLTKLREPAKLRSVLQGSAGDSGPGTGPANPDAARQPTQPLTREAAGTTAPLIQVLSSLNFDDTNKTENGNDESDKKNGEPQGTEGENINASKDAPIKTDTDGVVIDSPRKGEVVNESGQQDGDAPKYDAEAYLASLLENTSLDDNSKGDVDAAGVQVDFKAPKYGFNHGMEGFFRDILNEFPELVDLPKPDSTPEAERRPARIEAENAGFDVARYLGDLVGVEDDPFYRAAIDFAGPRDPSEGFSEEEQVQMRQLRNREFLDFSPLEQERALCAILDISLAYLYDLRATQGEHNVESAWTIRVLSPTLSWLDAFTDVGEVTRAVTHRCIVYPYIRHLSLAARMLEDGAKVLQQGRRGLLRCLLGVHRIFARSDTFYLLNRLYVTEMAIWIQQVDAAVVDDFCRRAAACTSFYASDPYGALRWDLRALENDFAKDTALSSDDSSSDSSSSSDDEDAESESENSDSSSDSSSTSSSDSDSDSDSEASAPDQDEEDASKENGNDQTVHVVGESAKEGAKESPLIEEIASKETLLESQQRESQEEESLKEENASVKQKPLIEEITQNETSKSQQDEVQDDGKTETSKEEDASSAQKPLIEEIA
ncbi:Protein SHQ1-like [Hondaea fermentalgiana]|uniref:Protein SHQ1-like n=1 Tax=Hondaea fermentalgiana TaxID=2315210 RepID=A0A2R5GUB8_9STRA|nr:Protein SHQ1-like [Hondaea fermentalgiana]|eukprot:GBG34440.1 Protein SHQ1-like [Hondaea fermentalgiana]